MQLSVQISKLFGLFHTKYTKMRYLCSLDTPLIGAKLLN